MALPPKHIIIDKNIEPLKLQLEPRAGANSLGVLGFRTVDQDTYAALGGTGVGSKTPVARTSGQVPS